MDTHAYPKIELHRHLEGSLRLQTILELSQRHKRPLPASTVEGLAPFAQVLEPMDSLQAVLDAFDLFQHTFLSYDDIRRVTFEAVEDAAIDNIRLLELRFSPDFMARPASLDWDPMMEAILQGVKEAGAQYTIDVGLIAIVSRSYGPQSAMETAAFAENWRQHLVGFDLADAEEMFPASAFKPAVDRVHRAGLPLTVHSGENVGADHIRSSIEQLGARRIGHGVSLIDDADLVAQAAQAGICIEACPTSNLRTHAVTTLESHPAKRLLEAGVPVSLNSDDPGLFAITLSGEIDVALNQLGLTEEDVRQCTRHALHASFLDQASKDKMLAETPQWQ